jgi:hypothetical protein
MDVGLVVDKIRLEQIWNLPNSGPTKALFKN